MTIEEAREFLMNISYKLGNMSVEYLSEKDGEKMREAISVLEQEPTTKNDLGVDAISRIETIDYLCKHCPDDGECFKDCDEIKHLRKLPSVTPQEPQTFKWCTGCREYDQEKHCCHRWSKVIRDTVEEMKQEQEPTTKIEESNFSQEQYKADLQSAYDCGKSILDKIRAEIMDCLKALDEIEKSGLNIYLPNEISGRRLTYQQCLEIIGKYEAEDGME